MKDNKVLAAINMFSIFRSIENLVEIDDAAKELVKNKKITIRFSVPDLPKFFLIFANGKVNAVRDKNVKSDINLKFLSVSHFNDMINEGKSPIPTKGFTKLGFLKNEFTKLTDILQTYLLPDEKRLETDVEFREKSTILTAYVAIFAAAQIGNYDEKLNELVSHMPDGNILVSVKDSIGVSIKVNGKNMTAQIGAAPKNLAFMEFENLEILGGVLRGTVDTYGCIGRGQVSLRGKIPMIDNFNKLLGSVSQYL